MPKAYSSDFFCFCGCLFVEDSSDVCFGFALLPFQAGVWFLLGCGYSNVSFSSPCFDVVSYKPHECSACVFVRRILFPGIQDWFFPHGD